MKQELPEAALDALKQNSKAGREAWKSGNFVLAEKYFLDAWVAIPEPKNDYDYSQSLSGGLVVFYRDTKQFDQAKKWLGVMRQTYSSPSNDYVEFMAATIHFEMGEFDAAFLIFDNQFKKFKSRPFEGEDKKYLEYYKKRKSGG